MCHSTQTDEPEFDKTQVFGKTAEKEKEEKAPEVIIENKFLRRLRFSALSRMRQEEASLHSTRWSWLL